MTVQNEDLLAKAAPSFESGVVKLIALVQDGSFDHVPGVRKGRVEKASGVRRGGSLIERVMREGSVRL